MQHLAKRIKEERQRLGWNQTQLANHLKTTKTTISKWETGRLLPDISHLPILARLFNTSVDELLNATPTYSREDTKAIISDLMVKLKRSNEEFISEIEAYFHRASHDYEFLIALVSVMSTNIQRFKEKWLRDKALSLAFDIIHIIEMNCSSASLLRKIFGYKVTFWYANREFDTIIEHLAGNEMNLGENLLLGSAYLARGDRDKCATILQMDIYQNLNLLVQEFLLLISQRLHHLSVDTLANKYEHLNQAFHIDQLFPFLAMPIYYHFADHYVDIDAEKAQHYLACYIKCFERFTEHFAFQTDAFFDHIESWFEQLPNGRHLSLDYEETVTHYMDIILNNVAFQNLSNYENVVWKLKQARFKGKASK